MSVKQKEYAKKYNLLNKDKVRLRNSSYYTINKAKLNKNHKNRRKNEREKYYLIDRKKSLKKKYKMSVYDYDVMIKKQDYKCAICGKKELGKIKKVFSIDHDHNTGKIRGLLCHKCNIGIGFFNDDVKILYDAIVYLSI